MVTRLRGALHRLDHFIAEGTKPAMTTVDDAPARDERQLAVDLFNGVWRLMEKEDRTPADDAEMIHMAHASCYHWRQVGAPVNAVRGEWQCSRVYATLGRAEPALFHARYALQSCEDNGIGDWDLAFCHEAIARAQAVAGEPEEARHATERALAAAESIAEEEDRELLMSDLETIPHQSRFW